MSENTKLECMIKLQDVITSKLNLEAEAERIPDQLHNDTNELNEANLAYEDLSAQLENAKDEEKSLSIRYADADHQSSEYQRIVETLTTQREYEAMAKQITEQENLAKSLLTARNAKIEEIKTLQANLDSQKELCDALQEKVNTESSEVESKLSAINEQIAAFDAQIDEIRGGVISEEFFNKFYNISKKKGGEGLVPVKGQVCMGCNTVLPMQFVIDLRLKQINDEIDTCPYCSRMIYYDNNVPAQEEKNYIFDDYEATKNGIKNPEGDETLDSSYDVISSDDMEEDDDL